MLDVLESEWTPFERALTDSERKHFAQLWSRARKHASASSYQGPIEPLHGVFFSILLEQEIEIARLRERLEAALGGSVDPRPSP